MCLFVFGKWSKKVVVVTIFCVVNILERGSTGGIEERYLCAVCLYVLFMKTEVIYKAIEQIAINPKLPKKKSNMP